MIARTRSVSESGSRIHHSETSFAPGCPRWTSEIGWCVFEEKLMSLPSNNCDAFYRRVRSPNPFHCPVTKTFPSPCHSPARTIRPLCYTLLPSVACKPTRFCLRFSESPSCFCCQPPLECVSLSLAKYSQCLLLYNFRIEAKIAWKGISSRSTR